MEKFVDRFANWLFTATALLITIFMVGYTIDNFRVVFNIFIGIVVFLGTGALVYELGNYLINKILRKKE